MRRVAEQQLVTSPDDPRVAEFLQLTDVALRRVKDPAEGLYMAESRKVIARSLAAGHRPRAFLMGHRWFAESQDLLDHPLAAGAPVYVADDDVLETITGFKLHRGMLASMHRPPLRPVEEVLAGARRVAVLEDVVDHTNVGAMFRSAAGLGVDAVLVTPRCADPFYRRSVRVSMGTVFQVPWTRVDPWPGGVRTLRDLGFTVAAMALRPDAVSLDDLAADPPERLAVVLGTEGEGLTAVTVDDADLVVRIPMSGGVDSLNVAAASAVVFWATRATG
ncbi:TrmH family RNA methyltransferase [Angustibacter speluncae]